MKFKKGDRVIDEDYGKGTVVKKTKDKKYPIEVFFDNQDSDKSPLGYTKKGTSIIGKPVTLKLLEDEK